MVKLQQTQMRLLNSKKQIAQLSANVTALMTENASLKTKLDDVHYRTANYNNGLILSTVDEMVVAVSPLHNAVATNTNLMKWGFASYNKDKTSAENMSWNTHASTKEEMDTLHQ